MGIMANFVALECWCIVVNLSVRAQIAAKNSRTLHRFSNSTNKFKLVVKWKEFQKSKTKYMYTADVPHLIKPLEIVVFRASPLSSRFLDA